MGAMPAATKVWTLEELHSLPDDGNKYELIHGVLYVTPGPTDQHETIAARLTRLLDPYVAKHGLGYVYHPRAVFNIDGSEVEPEIIVHEHCGESGAIGAAVEARRLYASGRRTRFIGLDAVRRIVAGEAVEMFGERRRADDGPAAATGYTLGGPDRVFAGGLDAEQARWTARIGGPFAAR